MPTRMAMDKLKSDLVIMGEMCENALESAVMGLLDRDTDLACYVMDYDSEIDEMELKIDRQCIDLIQEGNLSGDTLRFVSAASKITNDLERVGDLAVGVSEHVMFLVREQSVLPQVVDFMDMADQVAQMMRESIQSLLEADSALAWKIIDENRIVDDEMQVIFRELLTVMKKDVRTVERCCHILFIVQFLQRVAEKATNVAEEVIFMVEGVLVRHHLRELHPITHMPIENDAVQEVQAFEAGLLETRRPREEYRQEHEAIKRKTRTLSKDEVREAATSGRTKAKQARKKLLKIRAGKR